MLALAEKLTLENVMHTLVTACQHNAGVSAVVVLAAVAAAATAAY